MSPTHTYRTILFLLVLALASLQVGCDRSTNSTSRKSSSNDEKTPEKQTTDSEPDKISPGTNLGSDASPQSANTQSGSSQSLGADTPSAEEESDDVPVVNTPAGKKPWISMDRLPWETSQLQFIGKQRVGYTHIVVTPPLLTSSKQLRVRRTDSIEFLRAGQKTRIETVLETLETADGRILEFSETTTNGSTVIERKGTVTKDNIRLTTSIGGNAAKSMNIKLPYDAWGAMGVQAMLMQSPMEGGEKRSGKAYIPQLRSVVDVTLTALEKELTALADGKKAELLPVDIVMMLSKDNGVRSRNWVNDLGEIQKTVTLSGLDQSTFLTTRDVVQRIQDEIQLMDMEQDAFTLPLEGDLPSDSFSKIMYLVEGTEPYSVFPKTANQDTQSLNARRAAVIVSAYSNDSVTEEEAPDELALYSNPSSTVQSQFEAIEKMATELAGESTKKLDIALKLTHGVFEKLEKVEEFSEKFESAFEVTQSLSGDCTEHAVLLIALLRNRGIPARCASGLTIDSQGRLKLKIHLWAEAWIDNHWVPLDATKGTYTGPGDIKVHDSALDSENPLEVVMPVLEAVTDLRFGISSTE